MMIVVVVVVISSVVISSVVISCVVIIIIAITTLTIITTVKAREHLRAPAHFKPEEGEEVLRRVADWLKWAQASLPERCSAEESKLHPLLVPTSGQTQSSPAQQRLGVPDAQHICTIHSARNSASTERSSLSVADTGSLPQLPRLPVGRVKQGCYRALAAIPIEFRGIA